MRGQSAARGLRAALAAAFLVSVCALALCVSPAGGSAAGAIGGAYRDGIVLVRFAPGASPSARSAAAAQVGGVRVRTIGRDLVTLRVRGSLQHALAKLRRRAAVRYAEPDYLQAASGVPNDPSFGLQWALRNTGQIVKDVKGRTGADEHVTAAWGVTTGSPAVVVAEVDSGVDYTHPDLAGAIWSNPGGIGGCAAGTHGYNVLSGSCNPMDDETVFGGHGTHVAGIIGARGNNGVGVAGVTWSTTILPVKWLDAAGVGATSDLIAALDWVLKAKQAGVDIRIVNDSATFIGTPPSQALSDEIDVLGQNGILFVTAAGNSFGSGDDPAARRYPCAYGRPTEICVTASDQNDDLPAWANRGAQTVDLAAPGANVYSTLRGGGYGYVSGGSAAAAQVSGAAALVLAQTQLSTKDLRSDILDHVDPLPSLTGLVRTGGRLNVCKAIRGCAEAAAPKTFGTKTIGALYDPLRANFKRVNRYRVAERGTLSKLSVYLQSAAASGRESLRGVVYADQRGRPRALLGQTRVLVFHGGGAAGWYELGLPRPLKLTPGTYWIGVLAGPASHVASLRWKKAASAGRANENRYAAGATNPFGPAKADPEVVSLYATYTPGG
jgi:subtilisin family serine protease